MNLVLKVASDAWEEKQLQVAARSGEFVQTRLCLYHSGEITSGFFVSLKELLSEEQRWLLLPRSLQSWRTLSLGFAMISRAGAGVCQMMVSRHRSYPFRLFALLDPRSGVRPADILADPPCIRDSFSNEFLDKFSTKLDSTEARSVLACISLLHRNEISRIECRHAAVRRTLISNMTHTCTAERSSALFVLM
jgi:hypothetical protein